MFIRDMTRDDLPEVSVIANDVMNDELFTWLYPHFAKYPEQMRAFHNVRLRQMFCQVGSHGVVTVTEDTDDNWSGRPEIVGFTFFKRSGEDELSRKWKIDSFFKSFERHLLSLESLYIDLTNQASDPTRIADYRKITSFDYYETMHPRWHLALVAISPKHQRRGIGGMLVKYVQKIANEESLPITLESSLMGRKFYLKHGFKIVDVSKIHDDLDSIAMLWEPEHLQGRWLEDIEGDTAHVKGRKKSAS